RKMTEEMPDPNEKELRALLKREFPPFEEAELPRDLWPGMLRRLDAQPLRVPWFDWALAAAVAAALLIFPSAVPALLYQLCAGGFDEQACLSSSLYGGYRRSDSFTPRGHDRLRRVSPYLPFSCPRGALHCFSHGRSAQRLGPLERPLRRLAPPRSAVTRTARRAPADSARAAGPGRLGCPELFDSRLRHARLSDSRAGGSDRLLPGVEIPGRLPQPGPRPRLNRDDVSAKPAHPLWKNWFLRNAPTGTDE